MGTNIFATVILIDVMYKNEDLEAEVFGDNIYLILQHIQVQGLGTPGLLHEQTTWSVLSRSVLPTAP